MFVLRVILRKPWLAALAFVAVWTAIKAVGSHHVLIDVTTFAAIYAIAAFVVLRFGFIALAIGMFTVDLLLNIPDHYQSLEPGIWAALCLYSDRSRFGGLGMLHVARGPEDLEGKPVRMTEVRRGSSITCRTRWALLFEIGKYSFVHAASLEDCASECSGHRPCRRLSGEQQDSDIIFLTHAGAKV